MTVWQTSIVLLKEFFHSAESHRLFQNPLIFLLTLTDYSMLCMEVASQSHAGQKRQCKEECSSCRPQGSLVAAFISFPWVCLCELFSNANQI